MRYYFDGTEGILTVLPKVPSWCTVAGLICFLVSLQELCLMLAFFDFTSLCKIHEHLYCLKLFLAFGRICCLLLSQPESSSQTRNARPHVTISAASRLCAWASPRIATACEAFWGCGTFLWFLLPPFKLSLEFVWAMARVRSPTWFLRCKRRK